MTVYSERLGYLSDNLYTAGVPLTVFVAPADGATYVVRDINLRFIPGALGDTALLLLYPTAVPGYATLVDTGELPAGSHLVHWEGRQVLSAGDELIAFIEPLSAVSGRLNLVVSGYRLVP